MNLSASDANMGSLIQLAERVRKHPPAVAQRRYPLNTKDCNDPADVPVFGDLRLPVRFWQKVRLTDTCWVWIAHRQKGYGRFRVDDAAPAALAHRVAYEALVGAINAPQLDHLCRNRACVNPAHLEPVTNRENGLRGNSLPAQNARKTHCANGHKFTEENTYVRPDRPGRRDCLICKRAAKARFDARRKGAVDAPPQEVAA